MIFLRFLKRMALVACIGIPAFTSVGCAGNGGYAKFQPVPVDRPLFVFAVNPTMADPDAKTAGETVGIAAAKGAGLGLAGGVTGGVYLSVMCGPAIIICAPILVPGAAAVGLIGGTAMASTDAGARALPLEKAEALETIMIDQIGQMDFAAAMDDEFRRKGDINWDLVTAREEAVAEVELGVAAINFTQLKNDMLVLNVTTSMIVRYGPEKKATRRLLFEHHSDSRHVDYWLEKDGRNFRTAIEAGVRVTTSQIVYALNFEGRQRP